MSSKLGFIHLIQRPTSMQEEDWNSRFWLERSKNFYIKESLTKNSKDHCAQKGGQKLRESLKGVPLQKCSSTLNFPNAVPAIPVALRRKRKTTKEILLNRITFKANPKARASQPEIKLASKNVGFTRQSKQRFLTSRKPIQPLCSLKTLPTEKENKMSPIRDISESDLSDSSESMAESEFSLVFFEVVLSECLFPIIRQITEESINEGILAYLTLSSGKILYAYIGEVLECLVPALVKTWYEESKEQEPSRLRDQITEQVKEEEINRIVQSATQDILCCLTADNIIKDIPISELVEDCLTEIATENKEKELDLLDYLIDCFISEDWAEILVENTVTSVRLEGTWKLFPVYLQQVISQAQHKLILENISEDVYFDLLNKDLVSWLWEICREELECLS